MSDNCLDDLTSMLRNLPAKKRALTERGLEPEAMDGNALIARTLRRLGVTHVYGISGTPVYETHAACARSGIRVIGVRHQQAAAMMATAQNYVAGRLTAVAIFSAGPAITNAATGILVARDNGWPLLVLGGRRPLHMREMGSFQELDGVALYRPITKFADLITSAANIPESLARAVHVASSREPGPVYLDVAEEALQTKAIAEHVSLPPPPPQLIDAVALDQAAEILTNADRPVIIIGDRVRWSAPFAELERLVARLNAPFITSPMGRGFLPDDHPLCFNAASSFLLADADAVLALGAKLDWTFRYGAEIARNAQLIHIGIDARHFDLNLKPALGIVGDVGEALNQLLGRLPAQHQTAAGKEWRARLGAKRQEMLDKWKASARLDVQPMTLQRLMLEIRGAIPRDAITAVDGNLTLTAAQQLLPAYLPVSRLTPGNNGCMGVGIPFGIAAKLAYPERLVVVICGDMAFGINAMEMETAVRLRIPIIVIVANNEGNGGERMQKAFYPESYPDRVTMFQPGVRYEEIMRAFGGHAELVEYPDQLKPALDRAVESGVAACINVMINRT
ncbi:MAG: thiamine pyrophosphate-binding protein [Beijerinckiaceae bacterium]